MIYEEDLRMEIKSPNRIILDKCPWCNGQSFLDWGKPLREFVTVECDQCGLIFVKNRLNQDGLEKYYQANESLNKQRNIMYDIEYNLVSAHLKSGSAILDVGCSNGLFLDIFKDNGHHCKGVEFGEDAAKEASKKYEVWEGIFPEIKIAEKFDLIIMRGVIEHLPNPIEYLDKALTLLNDQGMIYITSTPNAASICCSLFKENWTQHVPEAHLIHFAPRHFDDYFTKHEFIKILNYYCYEETPYADTENDILLVAKAISLKKEGRDIKFISPAFWGNMMSLCYRKSNRV